MRRVLPLLLLAACSRPEGGRDGKDGRTCRVDGRALVTCDDGTSAAAPDIDGIPGPQGDRGAQGKDGRPGWASLIALEVIEPGPGCPGGGVLVRAGADADGDRNLDAEVTESEACRVQPPCWDASAGTARLEGDVRLENELDLRRFLLAGCTDVVGSLRLGGDAFTSIHSDMNGLELLSRVGGDAEIAYVVGSLGGLGRLSGVGGSLWIHDTPLRSLAGLEALREVGGDLVLGCNLQLTDLAALHGLTRVGGDLRVSRREWGAELVNAWTVANPPVPVLAGRILDEACPR